MVAEEAYAQMEQLVGLFLTALSSMRSAVCANRRFADQTPP